MDEQSNHSVSESNQEKPPSNRAIDGPSTSLSDQIEQALRQVYDPEIPVNIYDLGLIYKIDLDETAKQVRVEMTLTTPNCPEAESLPENVRNQLKSVPDIEHAEVHLVWEPPWDRSCMSEEAKMLLGFE